VRTNLHRTVSTLASLSMLAAAAALGQQCPRCDAAERRVALEKLAVVGSVLYIGAHPDDENSALLAYLAKGRKLRTAYLSLTRGDGGQNLIGTEQGELLGVLRTEEMLQARRLDGAEQYFTRAVDFGFSKTPEETLRIWGRDAVLFDIVWVIRSFRPDVIITRFPPSGDGGHGHHTASAILAAEAFTAAADPQRFPEQLSLVKAWQAKRLLWNAWRRPGEERPPVGKPQLLVDLGAYDALLGEAFTEIAAASRTMHKSQGAAIPPRRGSAPNYFELVAGEPFVADLLDGVDATWNRLPGGAAVAAALKRAVFAYSDEAPAAAVPALLDALAEMDRLAHDPWVPVKRAELLDVIRACCGLWLEAVAGTPTAVPGESVEITAVAINRSNIPVRLTRVELPFATVQRSDQPSPAPTPVASAGSEAAPLLAENVAQTRVVTLSLPRELPVSQPYWLEGGRGDGAYAIPKLELTGSPHSPASIVATFVFSIRDQQLEYRVPVVQRWIDPVEGEHTRELAVVPRVTVNLDAPVLLFPNRSAKPVHASVQAHAAQTQASVRLQPPPGWRAEPERIAVVLAKNGDAKVVSFTLTPPAEASSGELSVAVQTDREERARSLVTIDHPHIPPQTLLPPSAMRLVRADVKIPARTIGYVMGSGDEIPAILRQLGCEVTLLSDEDLTEANLTRFDAVVTGVRAYNTRPVLAQVQDRLLTYVERGGTLVVQYNTDRGLVCDRLGPFPLTVGRDRTTDETVPVEVLLPGHPLLTTPNKITAADFAGWVQERGLNYPSRWDPCYQALLSLADPGEKPVQGALLYARFGRGNYVYTGLAFFRQVPAGVPGAIRLFANLLARSTPRD
jgi:LmbE family N-acetylglucosaminyl deacetylase